jgi:ferredoxin
MPKLTVVPDGITVDVGEDETILEGLYRHGYAYRIGCRRGGCAICKVDLLDGEVAYNRPVADSVLTEEEKANGCCLTCRAVPTSDITIRLREENIRRVASLLALYAGTRTG